MSGGGSGGGSSGVSSWPLYMQEFQSHFLNDASTVFPNASFMDTFNSMYGDSPYKGRVAYNPSTDISTMADALADLDTQATAIAPSTDFSAMATTAVNTYDGTVEPSVARITNRVAAFSSDVYDQLNATIIPRYRAGMRDIGAVMSSAFTLGEAVLTADVTKQIAKFTADMYYNVELQRVSYVQDSVGKMASMMLNKLEFTRAVAAMTTEQSRLAVVMQGEYETRSVELLVLDSKWNVELYSYGSNILSGISGGVTHNQSSQGQSQLKSAIGGALSGAAMGAAAGGGNPIAIGAGAAIGLGMSFL
jgi:hypothetical protein